MNNHIYIHYKDVDYVTSINFKYSPYIRIYIEDVCIIEIFKYNNHNYYLQCFFYIPKFIFHREKIKTKKDLIRQINLLIESNIDEYL